MESVRAATKVIQHSLIHNTIPLVTNEIKTQISSDVIYGYPGNNASTICFANAWSISEWPIEVPEVDVTFVNKQLLQV